MNQSARSGSNETLQLPGREDYSFLSGLPASVRQAFLAVRHIVLYPRNSILFNQQQELCGVYMICSGRVKLSLCSRDGRTLTLRLAKPGEVLGLVQVLLGKVSQVTAEVLNQCKVEFVSRNDLMRIIAAYPSTFRDIARLLALQHEAACEQLRNIGLGLSVREKFARFLLHWTSEEQGANNSGAVELPLSHEEIAACIGVTRESVTRAFRKFKRLGLIERQGHAWVIPHPASIRKFVISEASSPEFAPLLAPRYAITSCRTQRIRSGQLRREAQAKRRQA